MILSGVAWAIPHGERCRVPGLFAGAGRFTHETNRQRVATPLLENSLTMGQPIATRKQILNHRRSPAYLPRQVACPFSGLVEPTIPSQIWAI